MVRAMNVLAHPSGEFWGDTTPCEHLLEVYKSEAAFLEGLVEFASEGLSQGEAFVMLASAEHRHVVTTALRARGHDLSAEADAFVEHDAAETLASVMVDGQPDAQCFETVIDAIVEGAASGGRRVRAFDGIVVLLWQADQHEATARLEQLWNDLLKRHPLTLFCAYPRQESTREITDDFAEVCAAHSQMAFT